MLSERTANTGELLTEYAHRMDEAFLRAVRKSGSQREFFCSVAGQRVRLSIASNALATRFTPALQHIRASPGPAGLNVRLWEGCDEPIPLLPEGWERARYFPRGRIPGMEHPDLRLVVLPGAGSVSLADLSAHQAWYAVTDAARTPFGESAAPLRNLLHAWLARRGIFVLHAAAIGTDRGAVLLVGKGGSGKSTTALVGLIAGMHYLGDDYCSVELLHGEPIVHSLYCSAKACHDAAADLVEINSCRAGSGRSLDEKAVYFFGGTHNAQLPRQAPLRAILLPRIAADRPTMLERATPGETLAALSPSTIMQLPDADGNDLAFHAQVAKAVPAYRLWLNRDRNALLRVIDGVLR